MSDVLIVLCKNVFFLFWIARPSFMKFDIIIPTMPDSYTIALNKQPTGFTSKDCIVAGHACMHNIPT